MEKRRQVTEEDLLLTEALIAKSYGQLKQAVTQTPARVYESLSQTAREHPYETAAAGVVAGVAVCGIIKMKTSGSPGPDQERIRVTIQKDTNRQDMMREMLPILMPMVAPYLAGYIRKYFGEIPSLER